MARRELRVCSLSIIGLDLALTDVVTVNVFSGADTSAIAHSGGTKDKNKVVATFTLPAADEKEDITYTFDVGSTKLSTYKGLLTDASSLNSIGKLDIKRDVLLQHAKYTEKLSVTGAFASGKRVLLQVPLDSKLTLALDVELGVQQRAPLVGLDDGQVRECNILLAAVGILATRGESTDSFARVMMLGEHEAEFEMGRTNVMNDNLSPIYNKYVRMRYSQQALLKDTIVRIEICDPNSLSKGSNETFTVIGAAEMRLADLHAILEAPPASVEPIDLGEGIVISQTAPKGAALMAMELRQKAELQKIVPPRMRKKKKEEHEALLKEKQRELIQSGGAASITAECQAMLMTRRSRPSAKHMDKWNSVELAGLLTKDFNLGTVLVAVESIVPSQELRPFIFSASKLRVNRCSLAPEPYLRVFKKLVVGDDALSLPGGHNVPKYCPIFRTRPHMRKTRNPVWGVDEGKMTKDRNDDDLGLPAELLVNCDGSPATILVEAWDWQATGKDRLIGRCEIEMADLNMSGTKFKEVQFQRPTFKDKEDLLDIVYWIAGCGTPNIPGFLKVSARSANRESQDRTLRRRLQLNRCFDIDETIRKLEARETSDIVEWVPLSARRAQIQNELRSGEEKINKSAFRAMQKGWRAFKRYWQVEFAAEWGRWYREHDIFYQSQLTIGADFGQATKALFVFSASVIFSNLLVWICWFPTWIPQILSSAPGSIDLGGEIASVFVAKGVDDLSSLVDTNGNGKIDIGDNLRITFNNGTTFSRVPPRGILFFSGYMPKIPIGDPAAPDMFPTAQWYVMCGFIALVLQLSNYTYRLYQVMASKEAAVSSATALPKGTIEVLNALFGGWDHTHFGLNATSKVRREIATRIKEGESDARRHAQSNAIVRTRQELQLLYVRRVFLMTTGFIICAAGVGIIVACLVPNPFKDRILVEFALAVPVIGPLFGTLIITATNILVPTIVKQLVVWEDYSPDVALRQTLARIFFVKMANAIAIFLNLGFTTEAKLPFGDKRCVEHEAAATYVQLLISDFVVVSLSFSLPKAITQTWLPVIGFWCRRLCGCQKKLNPVKPTKEPAPKMAASKNAKKDKFVQNLDASSPPASPPADDAHLDADLDADLEFTEPDVAVASAPTDMEAPSPPPSPPAKPKKQPKSGDAWGAWNSAAAEKTGKPPAVIKDVEEEDAFSGWRDAAAVKAGKPAASAADDDDDDDEVDENEAAEKARKAKEAAYKAKYPDYPLTGFEHKAAPGLELPKEVMELIYRQTLLFMGMVISPWLFLVGFVVNFLIYWVKFKTVVWFHKRPKEIKDHFGAGNATRDFYAFAWLATLFIFPFYFIFVHLESNPVCGPLRSQKCAVDFYQGNLTTCFLESEAKRVNYFDLAVSLLPDPNNKGSFSDPVPPELDDPSIQLVFKTLFSYITDLPVLMITIAVLAASVTFASAQVVRLSGELAAAKRELSIEYMDKKKLLRYAGMDI